MVCFLLRASHRRLPGPIALPSDECVRLFGRNRDLQFSRFQFFEQGRRTEQNPSRPTDSAGYPLALLYLIKSPPITGRPDIMLRSKR